MSRSRNKWRRALACAAVSALCTVSACRAAVDQVGAQGSGTLASPRDGGTLVVAQTQDPDPGSFLKTSLGNVLTEQSVLETLTTIDQKTGKPRGVLARSWHVAADGRSMDLTLRDGVKFHSGATLDADDVIFTLKKAQDPATGAANQAIASDISGMKAVGDDELKLSFSKPLPNIYDLFETMPILNPATYAQYAAGKVVDGTGPFVWKSWTPGAKVQLARFSGYRDADKIHLDRIEINIISDPTAMLSAIRSGRIQYGNGVSALDAYTLSEQPGFKAISVGGSAFPLAIDVSQKPFDNKLVRQAVQYAIDRKRIVQQVESGKGTAASLPWRETTTVGYDKAGARHYTYDPEKAKRLLKQAGVSDLSFNMVTLNTPEATGVFQIVRNNLAAVGLHADAEALSATEYDSRLAAGKLGAPVTLMLASNGLSPASAVVSRPELLAAGNPQNFSSPTYTRLVKDVTNATGEAAQAKALKAYDDYFLDQAFAVPVLVRPGIAVSTRAVHGLVGTQMGFINLNHVWLGQ
ncbi:ABC transporter substrate-binding protein [Streptomyces sp. NPDC051453]|uniref:ABC transporter substrate-binding protein n=1 Tax=Streptomyces sp. NPDC051453 TaxID=3154941 RepID=UPI00341693EC